jgi:putative oxidoreductase
MSDLGLLILRLVVGLTLTAHGAQKWFGWFGGPGIEGWSGIMARMGVRPAGAWARLSAVTEFGGGLMLALGLFSGLAAAGLAAVMVMAIVKVHWGKGFFNKNGGIEFPLGLLGGMIAIGLSGPGAYAMLPQPPLGWTSQTLFLIALTIGLLGDTLALASTATKTSQHHAI